MLSSIEFDWWTPADIKTSNRYIDKRRLPVL